MDGMAVTPRGVRHVGGKNRGGAQPKKWLFFCSGDGDGTGIRVFRRPVFRRKRDAPERGTRFRKLQTDFGFACAHRAEEDDMTLLLFLSAFVLHDHFTSAGHSGVHQNQGAMCVDRQGFGFFFECIALRVLSANADADLHQHTLAATPHAGIPWCIRGLCHTTSLGQLYPAGPDCRAAT
jgi:hypothetical protein